MLNALLGFCQSSRIESEKSPHPEDDFQPLPEDYAMRGLVWSDKYYPTGWFPNEMIEDDEKGLESASMGEEREIRVLYLGCRIARDSKWLRYDSRTRQFNTGFLVPNATEGDIDRGKAAGGFEKGGTIGSEKAGVGYETGGGIGSEKTGVDCGDGCEKITDEKEGEREKIYFTQRKRMMPKRCSIL